MKPYPLCKDWPPEPISDANCDCAAVTGSDPENERRETLVSDRRHASRGYDIMKTTTAIITAAMFSASMVPFAASAQEETIIPGNESQIELQNADERDNVASENEAETRDTSGTRDDTIIPGDEALIEENEAEERDAVAAGENQQTRDAMGDASTETLIPGSETLIDEQNAQERDRVAN
ncbi:MAG: hypothetical protein KAG89_05335 [Fulvimarina manganoxydans]|uniref:hypothetical protein n=1 Tax=Fulvimarina manganoxydans TaxID=937218 RepID=UPI0023549C6A|nr:hypothetical protein [Fulvimarina manganoxydans]MCK5931576.1 hypothetical protein [Fulvimarina manganoxydans]